MIKAVALCPPLPSHHSNGHSLTLPRQSRLTGRARVPSVIPVNVCRRPRSSGRPLNRTALDLAGVALSPGE